MSFDFNIDMNQVEDLPSGGPLPNGVYHAQVEEAEARETNDGSGMFVQVQFNVVGENMNGRKFWENFNVKNSSEKAQQIGLGRLKQLIVASGTTPGLLTDPSELVGLEMNCKLKVVSEEGYEDKNKVVSFLPVTTDAGPGQATTEIPKGEDGKPVF